MFTTIANDNRRSFPTASFGSLNDAIAYGHQTGETFTVCHPSGAAAATKPYADGEVVVY